MPRCTSVLCGLGLCSNAGRAGVGGFGDRLRLGGCGRLAGRLRRLAHAPRQLRERVLTEAHAPHTTRTITDPDRLRECLAEIRRTGVATTSGEMTVGTHSAAAPIRDRHDTVVAALSLVTGRRTADLRRLVPTVTTAARALSREVARHWTGSGDIGGDADMRAGGDCHPRG
ncbi:IclR family transcriptional regulator C-terminal domain-containing protein [Embleya sp. NPDC050493]|uniref:IclR family transcriptional regulator domain-containing protein n=1 Tax=Embleya sp. NPDC050493 TaxID=3363989 RepID=UPI00379695C9